LDLTLPERGEYGAVCTTGDREMSADYLESVAEYLESLDDDRDALMRIWENLTDTDFMRHIIMDALNDPHTERWSRTYIQLNAVQHIGDLVNEWRVNENLLLAEGKRENDAHDRAEQDKLDGAP
jgi:hypothetical protein